MNEFNVLLGAATNGTPSGSLFDALFARYIAPQESWRELESPLPITILAAGEDLIDYRIYGNTVQTGTPTPDNPIMPSGCGEKTVNLCPDVTVLSLAYSSTISTGNLFNALKNIKPDITHRISWLYESNGSGGVTNQIRLYTPGANLVKLINNGSAFSLTAEEIAAFTTIVAYFGISNTNGKMSNFMLTEGSTVPTSYIPYGYKLPMVVTNGTTTTTTPIYIGSERVGAIGKFADCVDYGTQKIIHRIIKIEFTGDEDWKTSGESKPYISVSNYIRSIWGTTATLSVCSHFSSSLTSDTVGAYNLGGLTQILSSRWNGNVIFNPGMSTTDFKSYLAAQYAAGTPVTLWYVCEMPTEEDPPVPLPALPTIKGETVIDYDGTPKPSQMYIKYKS